MLTTLQAQDQYILDSFAQFLNATVKSDYDTAAAATSTNPKKMLQFPTAVKIIAGSPDDISIVRATPSIALELGQAAVTGGSPNLGLGYTGRWRARQITLSCFPSLDAEGNPCLTAALMLRSFVTDALNGSECFTILDYSNPSFSSNNVINTNDVAYICKVAGPIPRSQTTALAQEKHRFDVHVVIEYPVNEKMRV